MSLIEWTDDLNVGIAQIDREHRQLVALINDLDEAADRGQGKRALGTVLDGMAAYADYHFRNEEEIFERLGYPDASLHKAEHAFFALRVREFRAGLEAGTQALSFEVLDFMSRWLTNHIQRSDRKFVPLFLEHGIR